LFFSQWSDYGNGSESNFGIEYENISQSDYGIDFGSDSVSASGREFDIDTEIESDIGCYIYCESRYLINLVINPLTYIVRHRGNTTLPKERIQYNSIQNIGLDENFAKFFIILTV